VCLRVVLELGSRASGHPRSSRRRSLGRRQGLMVDRIVLTMPCRIDGR
jgi:hypothetical protein